MSVCRSVGLGIWVALLASTALAAAADRRLVESAKAQNRQAVRALLESHADVNALDLAGAEALEWIDLQISAADTLKRVLTPVSGVPEASLDRVVAFTETKTVWHTKSLI